MKQLPILALACLLLCGCRQSPIPLSPNHSHAAPSALEASAAETRSALGVFPLEQRKVRGMIGWDGHLLLLSGYGSTTLTLLEPESLSPTASLALEFELSPESPSLILCEEGLSFYDPTTRETLILDKSLQILRRIAVPGNLVGEPVLSRDGKTLFYCTAFDVRAWDLGTNIRRCVKEMAYERQQMTAVLLDGQVLQCTVLDGTREKALFLSGENGLLLQEAPSGTQVHTAENRYYASVPTGAIHSLVFGTESTGPQTLVPEDIYAQGHFLPESQALVTVSVLGDTQIQLEYYDLISGRCRSRLALTGCQIPKSLAVPENGFLYILTYDPDQDRDVIHRCDIRESGPFFLREETDYRSPYYTAENPDTAGLARCRQLAEEIGQVHGIQVLIGEEAAAVTPWDYDLEPEYLVPVLQQELQLLKERLTYYPEEFLAATASHFSQLKLCLVRSIRSSTASGSPDLATGLQFQEGADTYVAIALGLPSEQALYHQLFHVIETRILSESKAFDHWNDLNPAGFCYDYDYSANAQRDSGVYLFEDHRAFVDTYSMSFPKEDRARIMEYAMLPGKKDLFRTEVMQKKLKTLCDGIRDAYNLEACEVPLLWEQYLE